MTTSGAAPIQSVTELMDALRSGQAGAAEQLVEAFYPDLRRIARNR